MAQQAVPSDQDPMHKTTLKNSNLLVLHVLLQPGESTGWHTHSRDAIAVRLSESEISVAEPGKPGMKPGGVLQAGYVSANDYGKQAYTHKVINTGKTPFEVFDVEFLGRPAGKKTQPIATVAAENASMRAYRWELAPGETSAMHAHERPYLIVAATPMQLKMTAPDGQTSEYPVKTGDLHWVDQKVTHTLTNSGSEKGVLVEIELK
jgi:mannose-6-phosphate isomerase-like protein (cupin superfamily)